MNKKPVQETTLLSPKLDFVFKAIFGDPNNIELLEALLKSILDLPENEYERIEIVNPFSLKTYPSEKQIILDVKVHTTSGKVIDVEIQCKNRDAFKNRIVYSSTKLLNAQLESGDGYDKLENVIAIVITDFVLLKDETEYHNKFHFRNDKSGRLFSDIIEINSLELPKLPEISDNTELWDFMQFLNAETEDEMEAVARENHRQRGVEPNRLKRSNFSVDCVLVLAVHPVRLRPAALSTLKLERFMVAESASAGFVS